MAGGATTLQAAAESGVPARCESEAHGQLIWPGESRPTVTALTPAGTRGEMASVTGTTDAWKLALGPELKTLWYGMLWNAELKSHWEVLVVFVVALYWWDWVDAVEEQVLGSQREFLIDLAMAFVGRRTRI